MEDALTISREESRVVRFGNTGLEIPISFDR